jgi:deoxycytidylate deaminase|tara:strand:- start:74 stop:418 length:345 start_codon:yes stop_codon:yes gene_type:complete
MIHVAKKASERSQERFKMGAVITRGNRVLAHGFNTNKTHPKFGSGEYKKVHAESSAICKCIRQGISLEGACIWIYRRNELLAKPCPCCMELIESVGIKDIYYTDGKGSLSHIKL